MASGTSESLFPRTDADVAPEADRTTGILPYQAIANGEIQALRQRREVSA
jgi:hypothetical protein